MKKSVMISTGLTILSLFLASCSQQQQAQQGAQYETMQVTATDKAVSNSYSATIRGRQDIDIMPQVSGTIQRLCVAEGDIVRKGQLLFVIDQVPYKAALEVANANMATANAELKTAQLNLENGRMLHEKKVISQSNLQTIENAYNSAKAMVAQASAQLTNARNNLSYTEVKAPCNGVVGTLPFRVGALVGPSMPQPLTTISDNSTMYVYFSMTENQLLALTKKHGSMANALKEMPEVELQLNDGSIYEQKGRIESISGVIDRLTGSVTARAVFDNSSRLLHSGASGAVIIPSSYQNVIVIPQEATVKVQDKVLVYKVVDNIAKSTLIKIAETNDGREYIVLDGITVGDEIVSKGVGLLREGTKVK
ncbi:MAG: efflux RND transporter periplasmic adaptor subunit [Muribaculaceae bacterium]